MSCTRWSKRILMVMVLCVCATELGWSKCCVHFMCHSNRILERWYARILRDWCKWIGWSDKRCASCFEKRDLPTNKLPCISSLKKKIFDINCYITLSHWWHSDIGWGMCAWRQWRTRWSQRVWSSFRLSNPLVLTPSLRSRFHRKTSLTPSAQRKAKTAIWYNL